MWESGPGATSAAATGALPAAATPPSRAIAMHPVVVVVRDTGAQAGEALMLGRRLAALWTASLVVIPVARHMSPPTPDGPSERRLDIAHTERWSRKILPPDCDCDVVDVGGPAPANEIHALAREWAARILVMPSEERARPGGVYLGHWEASAVVTGAPCAVAVAGDGHHNRPWPESPLVGVAFDGLPESLAALRSAHALARVAGGRLRVLTVGSELGGDRVIDQARALLGGFQIEVVELHGDPVSELYKASRTLDLLVCGSRDRRPLRRMALGRTSLALMRSAACPLIVVAPGTPLT